MTNNKNGENCVATSAKAQAAISAYNEGRISLNELQRELNKLVEINYIPTVEDVDYHKDYFFSNLDSFGVDPNNRPSSIDDVTVKKYAKAMINGRWYFDYSPIYVGIKTKNIFNGEHRRKAIDIARSKGLNPRICVRFVDDTDDDKLQEIRDALNSGRHWNSDDYVEAAIAAGNRDFIYLKNFCLNEDHPQLHSAKGKPYYNKGAIVLGSTYKEFKDAYLTGEWNIPLKDIETAEKRYGEMIRIKKSLRYDDAGQDCWIYIGMAWYTFTCNEGYMKRIKRLNEGMEDFYKALKYVDNTNSNKSQEWLGRFVEALEKAERHN